MYSQIQEEEEGNSSSTSSQTLRSHGKNTNYKSFDSSYEWNVEVDMKGQVDTGDCTTEKFSFNKLMQYTGPGMIKVTNLLNSKICV